MTVPRLLLDTLRLGTGHPVERLRDAWGEADPRGLLDWVRYEGCALWLYRRLHELRIAGPGRGFALELERAARRITARNMLVHSQTPVIAGLLRQYGIPFVFVKGVARLAAAEVFPYADARATTDVDVLVPSAHARDAWERLRATGYAPPGSSPPGHYHLDPLTNESGVAIEIHTSTSRHVPAEEAWRRASSRAEIFQCGGHTVLVPSSTELLWHGMVHSLSHGPRAFRLHFFLDGASVLASAAPIDWDTIRARLRTPEIASPDRAVAWLSAAAWLGGTALPAGILVRARHFSLGRTTRWRVAVARRGSLLTRWGRKLVDEGTRVEAGMPIADSTQRVTPVGQVRRRVAAVAARGSYLAWRRFSNERETAP